MKTIMNKPVNSPLRQPRACIALAALLLTASSLIFISCGSKKTADEKQVMAIVDSQNRSDQVAQKKADVPNQPGLIPKYHALVIGISEYDRKGGQGWASLMNARRDAEAVGDLLEKEYGFTVTRLFDRSASRDAVMVELDRISRLNKDDALLVYYAGHGYYEEAMDEGYWIPSDANLKKDGRLTKEDWIWNSTITKMISASPARHVLVIADSCYSGSLFRGGELESLGRKAQWYRRAITAPSRFLITSGDLEPVLDSGSRHSIFAQQILNYLQHPEKEVFSASDLGASIRDRVSTLTGQLVRMGPMKVASDAGGEFVFMRPSADTTALTTTTVQEPNTTVQPLEDDNPELASFRSAPVSAQKNLQDALLLASQGASNSAQALITAAASDPAYSHLATTVKKYLSAQDQRDRQASLQKLIDRMSERKKNADGTEDPWKDYAKPRIIACIGPVSHGKSDEDEARVLMYRLLLWQGLSEQGRIIAVEREALENVLAEMDLGTSDLADPRAQTEAGKLMPASLLILGDIIPTKDGDRFSLRLVDTSTSRLLGTFMESNPGDGDVNEVCRKLADAIADTAVKKKPLTARVLEKEETRLVAGVGTFQGAEIGASFDIVSKPEGQGYAPEKIMGTASITSTDEMWSEFLPEWSTKPEDHPAESILLVRERIK